MPCLVVVSIEHYEKKILVTVLIHIMHAERLDPMLLQDFLLSFVGITDANIDQLLDTDLVVIFQPPEDLRPLLFRQSGEESNWHTMNIAAPTQLRCIDVTMRIHPNYSHLSSQPLPDSLCCTGYRANGN